MSEDKRMTYSHTTVEKSDLTLNNILDIIDEGTWDWDGKTGQVIRSPSWFRMLGYEIGSFSEDVFTWENLIHVDDYKSTMTKFESYIKGKTDSYEAEYRCKKSDGSYIWIIDRGKIIKYNTDGSVGRMIGAHLNIDAQKKAQLDLIAQNESLKLGYLTLENIVNIKTKELENKNKELEKKIIEVESISNQDPLTKIANRKKFEYEFVKELLRAERYNHPLSLTIFDIDNFKSINDNFGHKLGDELLCGISRLVSENIREIDVFSRWGGDEFVIIFPELTFAKAQLACEKLRALIATYQVSNDRSVTCSFGLSEYQLGDTMDELFKRVDKMLFTSKEQGKNRIYSTLTES